MSIHIAITTGETVTPLQLVGEGEAEKADKLLEAQRNVAELEGKMPKLLPKAEGGTWREA